MSYLPKKAVLAGVKTRCKKSKDTEITVYEAYFGYDPFTRKPKRIQNTDAKKLKEQIERFYIEHQTGGDAAARLSPVEALDAREAIDTLATAKLGISLTECVRRFLAGHSAAEKGKDVISLGDAYGKFMAAQFGKSQPYLKALRMHVGKFVELFGSAKPITDVTAVIVKADLTERLLDEKDQRTWKTYNNHLGDIKTFMGWCAKPEQAFIAASPLVGMEKLKPDWKDPEFMRPAAVAKLFAYLYRRREDPVVRTDLAYAVLSFFCGMRTSEIERVADGEGSIRIDLNDRFIRVVKPKGVTNGIRPRCFRIPDTAYAWMSAFDFIQAAQTPNLRFRKKMMRYAKDAGVKVPTNAGRHTFITMHTAAFHDPNLLSSIVGNSETVRSNSYDGVTSEKEGKEYFTLTPERCVEMQNLIQNSEKPKRES